MPFEAKLMPHVAALTSLLAKANGLKFSNTKIHHLNGGITYMSQKSDKPKYRVVTLMAEYHDANTMKVLQFEVETTKAGTIKDLMINLDPNSYHNTPEKLGWWIMALQRYLRSFGEFAIVFDETIMRASKFSAS